MSEVKRYDISAFGGMSMDECRDGAYVNYDDYAALQAKCAAMAAENAGLKHAMAVTLEYVSVTDAGQVGVAAMIINYALHHSETPATDAFMAEVRAQGVEMFGQYHNFSEKLFIQKEAQKFAAHLRKGVDKKWQSQNNE